MKRAAGRREPPPVGLVSAAAAVASEHGWRSSPCFLCTKPILLHRFMKMQTEVPRCASPYLSALENRGTCNPAVTVPMRGSVPPSPAAHAALGQRSAATAARLQVLITRANNVTSTAGRLASAGSPGGANGHPVRRPASAIQQHRRPARMEQQRSASAMALRAQAHAAAPIPVQAASNQQQQHMQGIPSCGQPAAPPGQAAAGSAASLPKPERAGSRLGRLPTAGLAGEQAAGGITPLLSQQALLGPRPGSDGLLGARHPASPAQQHAALPPLLAAEEASRPPSRLQHYGAARASAGSTAGRRRPQLPPVRPFSASRPTAAKSTPFCSPSAKVGLASGGAVPAGATTLFDYGKGMHCQATAAAVVAAAGGGAAANACGAATGLAASSSAAWPCCCCNSAACGGSQAAADDSQLEPGLREAAENADTWLASLPPHPTASQLRQLVEKLLSSSSSQVRQPCGAAAVAAEVAAAGVDQQHNNSGVLASSQRVQQLFQQCTALRGEKAALERLNQDLSRQVGCRARLEVWGPFLR